MEAQAAHDPADVHGRRPGPRAIGSAAGAASPNDSHRALARLESRGRLSLLVTQSVDGLHGGRRQSRVVDLHGRLDQVRCMQCDWRGPRQAWQDELAGLNPHWESLEASDAPDGDADLDGVDFSGFRVPPCPRCGGGQARCGLFGETVPRERVDRVSGLMAADAVLVVGSSLMVYSGYRFVAAAARHADRGDQSGRTRADALLTLKVEQPCAQALDAL